MLFQRNSRATGGGFSRQENATFRKTTTTLRTVGLYRFAVHEQAKFNGNRIRAGETRELPSIETHTCIDSSFLERQDTIALYMCYSIGISTQISKQRTKMCGWFITVPN